jgi:tetratricopeptide (TPR) repeat protein
MRLIPPRPNSSARCATNNRACNSFSDPNTFSHRASAPCAAASPTATAYHAWQVFVKVIISQSLSRAACDQGRSAESQRHLADAGRSLHRAFAIARKHGKRTAIFQTQLGWFYLDHSQYDAGRRAFSAARQENPEHFVNYQGEGICLFRQGKYAEAAAAFRAALRLAPPSVEPARQTMENMLQACLCALASQTSADI